MTLVPRTQRAAALAMRSIVQFSSALQSRGPCHSESGASWVPAQRRNA